MFDFQKSKSHTAGTFSKFVSEWCFYFVLLRYHVPRSWFKPAGNVLVLFEEKGGDPTQITFSRRKSALCAHVSEDHPSFVTSDLQNSKTSLELKCPMNTSISAFKLASFGTPTGTCQSYGVGDCHDPNSTSIVEMVTTLLILNSFTVHNSKTTELSFRNIQQVSNCSIFL